MSIRSNFHRTKLLRLGTATVFYRSSNSDWAMSVLEILPYLYWRRTANKFTDFIWSSPKCRKDANENQL